MTFLEHHAIALDAHIEDLNVEMRINARYWSAYASDDAWWRTADADGVEQYGRAPGWTDTYRSAR